MPHSHLGLLTGAKVLRSVEERDLTFDVLQDRRGRIEGLYQTTGVPESFVINRAGVIVKRQIGAYEWDGPVPRAPLTDGLRREFVW